MGFSITTGFGRLGRYDQLAALLVRGHGVWAYRRTPWPDYLNKPSCGTSNSTHVAYLVLVVDQVALDVFVDAVARRRDRHRAFVVVAGGSLVRRASVFPGLIVRAAMGAATATRL